MKTTLIKEDFVKAVLTVNRFIPLRPSLPVLANILVESEKGRMILSGTNLETSIRIEIPAKNETPWQLTVPARILSEFVSSAREKEIIVESDKEALKISSGELKATINGIDASEFPKIPLAANQGEEFERKDLGDAVSQVGTAASSDEGKPILTGMLLRREGEKTILVATDGYRLGKKTLAKSYNFEQTIIPAKTLSEALKVAGEFSEEKIKIFVSDQDNQIFFVTDSFTIVSRVLDGAYPQFEQIIPAKFSAVVKIKKEELADAIKAAAIFARDIGNVVKLDLKDNLIEVSANTLQVGEADTRVTALREGESFKVAFNSQYFLDGLSSIKDSDIEVKFSGPLSPALIKSAKDSTFFYIVMPVKVQS